MRRSRLLMQNALILMVLTTQQLSVLADAPQSSQVQPPSTISLPTSSVELRVPILSDSDQHLFDLLQSKDYPAAKKLIQSELGQAPSKERKNELQNLLAYVCMRLNNLRGAIKSLQIFSQLLDASAGPESARRQAVVDRRVGDLYLRMRKKSNAIAQYRSALSFAQKIDSNDPVLVGILEPLVGCLVQDEQYKDAQPYAEQLVSICQARAKSGQLVDASALFWADLQLSQIYNNIDAKLHEQFQPKTLQLLDQLLTLRSQVAGDKFAENEARFEKLQQALMRSYVEENKPVTLSDYLWVTSEYRMRSLPLISWLPADASPRAIILCVHGLGLENAAFGALAKRMNAKNYGVYALDVRGFGAWQSEFGSETVNFDRALKDMKAVIEILKKRHPGLPVFLLGESMGGAMVLRAASEFGDSTAGVISSVPSAEQYHGKQMASEVVFRLLRPNEPFNIGKQIEQQATNKEDVRKLWRNDPKAKMNLSPAELIKFDRFMKTTKKRCADIRSTPVMVVQGMADKLAKPKGSYEMYDNVNSPDKTMIVIGSAEHLIFETTNQSQVLIDGLSAWIDDHIAKK